MVADGLAYRQWSTAAGISSGVSRPAAGKAQVGWKRSASGGGDVSHFRPRHRATNAPISTAAQQERIILNTSRYSVFTATV